MNLKKDVQSLYELVLT